MLKKTPILKKDFVKFFLIIFLPISIVVAGIEWLQYYSVKKNEKNSIEMNEMFVLRNLNQTVNNNFGSIVSDLMVMAKSQHLQKIFDEKQDENIRLLSQDFLNFIASKKIYNQIRFIDKKGMELVRVDLNNGHPAVIPKAKLQSKVKRYYFNKTMGLDRGKVYVSPFDLNIEKGKIEQPLKPTIRFGTPVFDNHENQVGIIMLNFLGKNLLNAFENISITSHGKTMLLNRDGYWLKSSDDKNEWGFMLDDRKDKTFGNVYADEWKNIQEKMHGQFYTSKGVFTFVNVYPLLNCLICQKSEVDLNKRRPVSEDQFNAGQYYWKIVSHVDLETLTSASTEFFKKLFFTYMGIISILAAISFFLARARASHKLAEKAVREAEKRYENLVQTLPDIVYEIDPKGYFTFISNSIRNLGFEPKELIGKHFSEIIHPDDFESVSRNTVLKNYPGNVSGIKERKTINLNVRLVQKDQGRVKNDSQKMIDSTIAFSEITSVEYFEDDTAEKTGVAPGTVGIIRDITKRMKAAQILKETEEQLRHSAKLASIGELAGGVAHEIRTCLGGIMNYVQRIDAGFGNRDEITEKVQSLQQGLLDNISKGQYNKIPSIAEELKSFYTEIDKYENRIRKSKDGIKELGERGTKITNDLLTFSRRHEPQVKPACMNKIMDNVLDIIKTEFEKSNIEITTEYDQNLPKSNIDVDQIGQVFANITINARNAMSDGGTLNIKTGLDTTGKYVEVHIKDTGCGIYENDISRIFDPFFTTSEKGTGLGLSVSYGIIKNHKGSITVKSKVGAGTIFKVQLPVQG